MVAVMYQTTDYLSRRDFVKNTAVLLVGLEGLLNNSHAQEKRPEYAYGNVGIDKVIPPGNYRVQVYRDPTSVVVPDFLFVLTPEGKPTAEMQEGQHLTALGMKSLDEIKALAMEYEKSLPSTILLVIDTLKEIKLFGKKDFIGYTIGVKGGSEIAGTKKYQESAKANLLATSSAPGNGASASPSTIEAVYKIYLRKPANSQSGGGGGAGGGGSGGGGGGGGSGGN